MYAIINTGGKQAKVRPGDVIDVELLHSDEETIEFEPILVVDDGSVISDSDRLADMPVSVRILGETKGPKINIFKYKNKTGYRRRMGHRQRYTRLEVLSIGSSKASKGSSKKASTVQPETAHASEEE